MAFISRVFFIASSCLVGYAQREVAGRGVVYQLLPKYFIRIVLSVLTRNPCGGKFPNLKYKRGNFVEITNQIKLKIADTFYRNGTSI